MIGEFSGEFRFLSNFWPAEVEFDGMKFSSVEHAFQAAKTLEREWRLKIQAAATPGKAKRLGKQAIIRRGWLDMRVTVMRGLLVQKFQQEPLRSQLLATGDKTLVEGNTWSDVFWGACDGFGENHLGKLLMEIREELRSGDEF